MDFDINVLRTNIEKLCKERGISINAMAESIGVRQSTISGIMIGRSNNPTIQVLTKIANFFGITLDALIGRTGNYISSSNEQAAVLERPAM